jgi:1-acyl-sn-glycerol-3-phosphate acyltransferase
MMTTQHYEGSRAGGSNRETDELVRRRPWIGPLYRIMTAVYYGSVRVAGRENLPAGAALVASNHRSGGADGVILRAVERGWTLMVGANLARHPLMRYIVDGLVVERTGERVKQSRTEQVRSAAANQRALEIAATFVASGGQLCVFPEGTSSFGPKLLPLRPGIAAIYLRQRSMGGCAPLIPVAIHYPDRSAFRGPVEVTIGTPIEVQLDPSSHPKEARRAILERLQAALEAISVNARDEDEQRAIEGLATLALAGNGSSHGDLCRALARGAAGDATAQHLIASWHRLAGQTAGRKLARFTGVPLYPQGGLMVTALKTVILWPVILAAAIVNLPIILAADGAARRLADDENVVALWRLLAGLAASCIWWLMLVIGAMVLMGAARGTMAVIGAALITALGLLAWRPWRLAVVTTFNAIRFPDLSKPVRELREETLRWYASR